MSEEMNNPTVPSGMELPTALAMMPVIPQEPSPAEILKKRVYIGFAATMALGLAVAGAYISGRLFAKPAPNHAPMTATSHLKPNSASAVETKPAVAPVVVDASVPESSPAAPADKPEPAAKTTPAPEPVVTQASEAATDQKTPVGELITPKHGQKYLQLAALGPTATVRYIPELKAGGIEAHVAPGPDSSLYRIVVGPFQDQPALERQRDALEAAGIQSILRVY
jgi:cell division septation protein DedD